MSGTKANENSFATFCYPADQVKGKHLGLCMGDVFSVNWMKDTEASDISKETILQQFYKVKELTETSKVTIFGDKALLNSKVGEFLGSRNPTIPDSLSDQTDEFGGHSFFHNFLSSAEKLLS